MIVQISEAFVLQSYETGNTSEVIRIFAPKYGSLSVLAKGLLRKGKQELKTTLQPMNLVEMSLSLSEGKEMGVLREANLLHQYPTIRKSLKKYAFICLILDMSARGIEPGEQSQKAMSLLLDYMNRLEGDDSKETPANLEVALFSELLGLLGYLPDFSDDLLRPWPKGEDRPKSFCLDLDSGRLFLPERYEIDYDWPNFPSQQSTVLPVPPSMVRYLFDFQKGEIGRIENSVERLQMIYSLCRLLEWHDDVRLPSFRFWFDLIERSAKKS